MNIRTLLLAGVATSVMAGYGMAQTAAPDAPAAPQPDAQMQQQAPASGTDAAPSAAPAGDAMTGADAADRAMSGETAFNDLKDANINNAEDESVATIADVLISPEGQAENLVLAQGGVLGVGTTYKLFPIEQMPTVTDDVASITMTEEEVEALAEYTYPAGEDDPATAEAPDADDAADTPMAANPPATAPAPGASAPAADAPSTGATTAESPATAPAQSTDMAETAPGTAPAPEATTEGRAATDATMAATPVADLWPVSEFIGVNAEVSGEEDVTVEVSDVHFDGEGKVTAFIVTEGGVLGVGGTEHTVAFEDVTIGGTQDDVELMVANVTLASPPADAAPAGQPAPGAAPAPAPAQ